MSFDFVFDFNEKNKSPEFAWISLKYIKTMFTRATYLNFLQIFDLVYVQFLEIDRFQRFRENNNKTELLVAPQAVFCLNVKPELWFNRKT